MENYYSEHEGKTIDKIITDAGLHMQNYVMHVTQTERENWNSKASSAALLQLQSDYQQTTQQFQNVIEGIQSTIETKMDGGELEQLTNLNSFQVSAILALTIGWETEIKPLNSSNNINEYIIPIPFNELDEIKLEFIEGSLSESNRYFVYGNGNSYAILLQGTFNQWLTIPSGGNSLKIGAIANENIKVRLFLRHT